MFPVKPVSDILIVKQADNERISEAGIVVPDVVERPEMGEVVAVGPGELVREGERAPMFVKVGDRVLFHKNMVQDIRIDGVEYKAVRQRHCHGVI